MSNTTELDDLVAEIALNLPTHPTSAQFLGALSKAARGGFAIGVNTGQNHQAHVTDLVNRATWEPR